MDTIIAITAEELSLLRARSEVLEALEAAGVDNWEGYGDAMRDIWEAREATDA